MLIVGAGGLATQLFEDLLYMNIQQFRFWSEQGTKYSFLHERIPLVTNDDEVIDYFNTVTKSFLICVSGPEVRRSLENRFKSLGGNAISYISPASVVSRYADISNGAMILSRVEVEAGVKVGAGTLLNKTANIGHGCIIGDFCEIAPGVILTGEVEIGNDSFVGTRAIILPKVKIGNNVTIAAGAIVKKNVPDNAVVANEFATIKFYKK